MAQTGRRLKIRGAQHISIVPVPFIHQILVSACVFRSSGVWIGLVQEALSVCRRPERYGAKPFGSSISSFPSFGRIRKCAQRERGHGSEMAWLVFGYQLGPKSDKGEHASSLREEREVMDFVLEGHRIPRY